MHILKQALRIYRPTWSDDSRETNAAPGMPKGDSVRLSFSTLTHSFRPWRRLPLNQARLSTRNSCVEKAKASRGNSTPSASRHVSTQL